jgi:hypothetical protein
MSIINIYKISCNVSGLQYYGSTSQSIKRRLQHHEKDYKRYVAGKTTFTTSYDIIKNGDYKIELMEECNDENRNERESYYIRNFECVNKVIPDRTNKERMDAWLIDNKEHKKENDIEYYQKNKEKCLEKSKEWYQNNIERKKEYDIEYYEKKKEEISNKGKERILCECGTDIARSSKSNHIKSKKHLEFII